MAKDITVAAWTFLPKLEREFFCKRWNEDYQSDSDNIRIVPKILESYSEDPETVFGTLKRILKLLLCKTELELDDTKKYLIKCIQHPTVGLAAMGESF